jgi:undecaprenyl-phosphate galactose phosphotransferase
MNNLPPAHRLLQPLADAVALLDHSRPRKRGYKTGLTLFMADVVGWIVSFLIGLAGLRAYTGFDDTAFDPWWHSTGINQLLGFGAFASVASYAFFRRGHYQQRRPFWMETGEVLRHVILFGLLYGVFVVLAKMELSRSLWLVSFTSTAILLPSFRRLTRELMMKVGWWQQPTIIIGSGEHAVACYHALASESQLGFRVLAFLQSDQLAVPSEQLPDNLLLLTWPHDRIDELVEALRGYHLVVALDPESRTLHEDWLEPLSQRFLDMHIVPPLATLPLVSMEPQHFFSHDILLLRARNNLLDRRAQRLKRWLDIIGSLVLIVTTIPLVLMIIALIRLEGGPAIFGQMRVGRKGKPFTCYKFRTMRLDAEECLQKVLAGDPCAAAEYKQFHKLRDDPRVTRVGMLLRKTSLDELPQIYNVLCGTMSLVGPRPRLPKEPSDFYYEAVRPGITGLWQVSGRNQLTFKQRVALDLWYVRNWNAWYDLAILCKTIKVVLLREGAF